MMAIGIWLNYMSHPRERERSGQPGLGIHPGRDEIGLIQLRTEKEIKSRREPGYGSSHREPGF